MSADDVGSVLPQQKFSGNIKEPTLVIALRMQTVWEVSQRQREFVEAMKGAILERSPTNANSVGSVSLTKGICGGIKGPIPERSFMNANGMEVFLPEQKVLKKHLRTHT